MHSVGDNGAARWEFKVSELLEKLKTNREEHIKEALEAREGYKKALKATLEAKLAQLEKTGDVDTYIKLEKPTSHESDYDRIIEVLEMTTAKTVLLTLSEFDKYVRDNWDWTRSFKMSNSNYVGAAL